MWIQPQELKNDIENESKLGDMGVILLPSG